MVRDVVEYRHSFIDRLLHEGHAVVEDAILQETHGSDEWCLAEKAVESPARGWRFGEAPFGLRSRVVRPEKTADPLIGRASASPTEVRLTPERLERALQHRYTAAGQRYGPPAVNGTAGHHGRKFLLFHIRGTQ